MLGEGILVELGGFLGVEFTDVDNSLNFKAKRVLVTAILYAVLLSLASKAIL